MTIHTCHEEESKTKLNSVISRKLKYLKYTELYNPNVRENIMTIANNKADMGNNSCNIKCDLLVYFETHYS